MQSTCEPTFSGEIMLRRYGNDNIHIMLYAGAKPLAFSYLSDLQAKLFLRDCKLPEELPTEKPQYLYVENLPVDPIRFHCETGL